MRLAQIAIWNPFSTLQDNKINTSRSIKINSWKQVDIDRQGKKYKRIRWRFIGEEALELESKVGCLVTNFKNHRVTGPIFYINF